MDISIIIVSWKLKEKLRHNLEALILALKDIKAEIFVVDNNSQDGTVEMIQREYKDINLIINSDNLGFAKANNQAIGLAKADFILLLNPDMKVFPETISQALAWAKVNTQATVSGFYLQNENGDLLPQVRRFPSLRDQLLLTLKLPHIFPALLNKYLYKDFDYSLAQKVDSIRGSFFLINRNSWRNISGLDKPFLDERYFIWFEEVDFCRQVYKNSGEVWYSPVAKCRDYIGQSFKQLPRDTKQIYFRTSMLAYFKKWHSLTDYYVLKAVWSISNVITKIFKKYEK